MTRFLISRLIPNWQNTGDKNVRTAYCTLAGCLGILCNFFLFLVKLIIGGMLGSIAVTSDAFNNLSDMGSSAVSVISAKLSGRDPDAEHPFGHGRFEYVASLFVGVIILIVGFELGKTSVEKILHPEPMTFAWLPVIILALSVLVKVWMFLYNRYMGKCIDSPVLRATASDSINDVISTSAVILCTVVGAFLPFSIDGYVGVAVSLLILWAGIGVLRETVGLLLGGAPDPETVRHITDVLREGEGIVGIHDLIVHDYGPGRCIASVHAEVPADCDVIRAHEIIDALEQRIRNELGILMVIHMDPIVTDDPRVNELRDRVGSVLSQIDPAYSFHDFRITDGVDHKNLIFDVEVPITEAADVRAEKIDRVKKTFSAYDPRIACVISVDTYIPQKEAEQ